jgi:signal transduction histidine kinase/CheY-like chemotaxis protein
MASYKRKLIVLHCFIVLLYSSGQITLYGSQENNRSVPVKVGVYENHPKIFVDNDGNPDGIFVDVLEAIARNENLEIEYVPGEWSELIDMLGKGEIDVLPDVAFTEERDSLFRLNTISVLDSWIEIFTTRKTHIHSVLDLEAKRIGVLRGSIQEEYLKEFIAESYKIAFEIVSFSDYEGSVTALKNHDIDVIIANRFFYFSELFDDEIVPTGIILKLSELFFAFRGDIDPNLVNLFDKNLAFFKNNPESEYYASFHSWFKIKRSTAIPKRLIWLNAIIGAILLIVTAFALLLRYEVRAKTKILRLQNEELIIARDKAEESDRLKTVFLQNMSHEIRTPMNGILGFLGLIKNNELNTEDKNKYINIVNRSGERLLNTINNIIEISKIESNQIALNYSKINISELLNFYQNFFKHQAGEKGLLLELSQQIASEKSIVESDKYLLDSILINLISNAIKFTDKGKVEFGCYLKENTINFYVKDTGMGIPSDRLEAIFDRFVQGDLDITRPHEGSGLGLSIVKAYVEKLDGKIWVESFAGKGSTFFFKIPYRPVKQENDDRNEPAKTDSFGANKLTILVAEDDEISYLYIQSVLKKKGIKLLRAKNGKEAVQMLKDNQGISLVLMDIKMPVLDGLEATQQIRQFNGSVPIIAQTAYVLTDDRSKVIRAGCNDYISKPINTNNLIRLIQKYV